MICVRESYDRFLLVVIAFALLACSAWLARNTRQLCIVLNGLNASVSKNVKFSEVDLERVKTEASELDEPFAWSARMINGYRLPLFASAPYIVGDPLSHGEGNHTPLHPPVPNEWLINNKQDLLSPNVLEQDSDGDGFSTLDEYNGKTDPTDKNSHPPYWTKLTFTKLIRVPTFLNFEQLRSVAGHGKTLFINKLDGDHAAPYLKIGQIVPGTEFKIVKFEAKTEKINGTMKDVSVATLENQETHEQIILVKGREEMTRTIYAVLNYTWTGKPFAVKRNQEFTLKPEDTVKYKCLDMNETEVLLLKKGEQKEIRIRLQKPVAK